MIDHETIKLAIAYRSTGLTLGVISDKLKVSQSALKQIFKRFNTSRGSHRTELAKKARELLINDTTLASNIAAQVAASISSDVNIANQIRDNTSLMLEQIYNDSSTPTAQKSRSLAALATAASVAQAISFRALEIDKQRSTVNDDDLPSLSITGYSNEEVEDIRRRASLSELELSALEENEL